MNQDYSDLSSAFHAHGVKHLIVGGYAVIFHAQPRFTKDIDMYIKPDPANAGAVYSALAEFGVALQGIRVEDFSDLNCFFRFGREPQAFDIMTDIPGVDFDTVWERRVEAVVDAESGLKAFIISREDLIASKLATGRIRDLADVEDLRKAEDSTGRP